MFFDLKRRIPKYPSDIYDGIHPKIIFSTIFMFFTSIGPALAFGFLLDTKTNHAIGVVEVLFSTSLCGLVYAFISGQPMVIVGVTGPISIFTITVYNLSQQFGIPFVQWYAMIGYYSAAFHFILALTNSCTLIRHVTRFSGETFAVLIAVIYIQEGIQQVVSQFQTYSIQAALYGLIIAIGSFYVAYELHHARGWSLFTRSTRRIFTDAAVPISIGIWTGMAYAPKISDIPFLHVPTTFQPTSGRAWVVSYDGANAMPVWAYFAALLPALILTALLFFDHNVSSLLSQRPEYKLKKGSAYHWDFFVIGINLAVCSIIGIPPVHGLIPQSPLHVKSLMTVQAIQKDNGQTVEICTHVREQRVSGVLQTLLILMLIMFGQVILRLIPLAVIAGIFLFMGLSEKNQFIERVKMWFTDPNFYNHLSIYYIIKKVPLTHIVVFTLIQIICFGAIYGITWTQAAIGFPILILLLIPLRLLMPLLFTREQLFYLDGEGDERAEYNAEPNKKYIFGINGGPLDKIHALICRVIQFSKHRYMDVKNSVSQWFLRTKTSFKRKLTFRRS
jgi:hypothetical protein